MDQDRSAEKIGSNAVALLATALIWSALSAACAAPDRSGADCLDEGVTRLGATTGTKLTLTCELGEQMMLIAMPPPDRETAEPPADQVPEEISVLIRRTRGEGYNWCVFPTGLLAALTSGKDLDTFQWECRRVLATFQRYLVTTGTSLEITLARGVNGAVDVLDVTGSRP